MPVSREHNLEAAVANIETAFAYLRQLPPPLAPSLHRQAVDSLTSATRQIVEIAREQERRIVASQQIIQELHQDLEAVRAEALTDELTGLANHKRLRQVLKMEAFEAEETGEPLCLAFADVDNFKRLNDCYGHQAGDRALRLVAQIFQQNIKAGAHACRYGGEEFALVFPKTELAAAIEVANAIRLMVKTRELVRNARSEPHSHVTLSIGVAAYRDGEPVDNLLQRADDRLYAAKQMGRDRVEADNVARNAA
jgi:diguanylate cyclase